MWGLWDCGIQTTHFLVNDAGFQVLHIVCLDDVGGESVVMRYPANYSQCIVRKLGYESRHLDESIDGSMAGI